MKKIKNFIFYNLILSIKKGNLFCLFLMPFLNYESRNYLIKYTIKYNNKKYFKILLLLQKYQMSVLSIEEYRKFIDKAALYNNDFMFNYLIDNISKIFKSTSKYFHLSPVYHSAFKYMIKNENLNMVKKYIHSEYFDLENNTISNYVFSDILYNKNIDIVSYILNLKKIQKYDISNDLLFYLLKNREYSLYSTYIKKHIEMKKDFLKTKNENLSTHFFTAITSYLVPLNLFKEVYHICDYSKQKKIEIIYFLITHHYEERIDYIKYLFESEESIRESLKEHENKIYNRLDMKNRIINF